MTPEFISEKFSNGFCGSYAKDHKYFAEKEWGLMYTPEASLVIDQMREVEKGLNEAKEIDCWDIFEGNTDHMKYLLNDEAIYYKLHRRLSKSMRNELVK